MNGPGSKSSTGEHATARPAAGQLLSLVDRKHEVATLEQLLETVRNGGSRALFVHGDPGIGKSALLEKLLDSASGFRVARAVGVEGEADLPYAGLQQLCRTMLDMIERLPPPQRRALNVAFGVRSGEAPDRYLVGLAALTLFSEAAADKPLLCVVDDAQWLDTETTRALVFVARRLGAETVGLVIAGRELIGGFLGLPALHLGGLATADAQAVLDSALTGRLDAPVRERFLAETQGNPLALLELPYALTAAEASVVIVPQSNVPLWSRIEESFRVRIETLPEQTRKLLVLAAAEPLGDQMLLIRAATQLGLGIDAADAAAEAGLFEVRERCFFRHPLVRSAVYRSATPRERRQAHHALAEATDPQRDPDRRAWHRGQATAAPDEDVAAELEHTAARARSRGGLAAGAAFLERAAVLTPDVSARAERTLAAAQVLIEAGAFDSASALVATAEAGPLDEFQLARAELLHGQVALFKAPGAEAAALLMKAAKRLERFDAGLARDTYLDAWRAAGYRGRIASGVSQLEVSQAARSAPRPDGPPRASDLLLDSLATLVAEGRASAHPLLREATRSLRDDPFPLEFRLRWGSMAALPAYALWDEESAHQICVQQVWTLREAGALALLSNELQPLILLALRCGDFRAADAALSEASAVGEVTGTPIAPFWAMMLAVLRGREPEATALIESVRKEATDLGQEVGLQFAAWMFATLCNGLARYQDAAAAAQQASNDHPEQQFVSAWASTELLEAASRTGNTELARLALERILGATEFSNTDSARGIAARSRALVAEGSEADQEYRAGIDHLSRSRLRPELARAHLLHGEWLRREGRRIEARDELHAADEMLTEIGMETFAERARRELAATGETARRRVDETRFDLTAQEAQIARLASEGLTNPQIGARLFLSPRTVEWHLGRVYPKLGISSRRQLHTVTLPT